MDKSRRLKVYSEKDYSEIIDFPVELVGRDGVVRKYSYADSIRIYQRRIESAHVRYSDLEIINAEISHCTKRLEQLHRSWKHRMRRFERDYVRSRPVPRDREFFERGKQFVRNYLEAQMPGSTVGPETREINLVLLEDGPGYQVFYVNWPLLHPGTLLYAYRVAGDDGAEQLEAYRRNLELLRALSDAPDTEKLLHHEQGTDLAFILSGPRPHPLMTKQVPGRAPVVVRLLGVPEDHPPFVASQRPDSDEDPYRLGLEELRWKNYEQAFDRFAKALETNPYYKQAYWAVGEIARKLDLWDEAAPYLLMALKYFPEEPRSHFYHGRLLFAQGDLASAEAAFERAVQLNLKQARGIGFLACTQALRGRYQAAAISVERGLDGFPDDRSLMALADPIHLAARYRTRSRVLLGVALVALVSVFLVDASRWVLTSVSLAPIALLAYTRAQIYRLRRVIRAWATRESGPDEFPPDG